MGRIGAGEGITMLFGLLGPLAYLAIGLALVFWGRAAQRAGRRFGAAGFYTAAAGLLVVLGGGLVTVIGLIYAFEAVASTRPEARSTLLAQGISEAMNAGAFGALGSLVLYVVAFVLLVLSSRRAAAATRAPGST